MAHKVNFSVKTQANAYREGYLDATRELVNALVEGGNINFLLEYLANNTDEATRIKLDDFYDAQRAESRF